MRREHTALPEHAAVAALSVTVLVVLRFPAFFQVHSAWRGGKRNSLPPPHLP